MNCDYKQRNFPMQDAKLLRQRRLNALRQRSVLEIECPCLQQGGLWSQQLPTFKAGMIKGLFAYSSRLLAGEGYRGTGYINLIVPWVALNTK